MSEEATHFLASQVGVRTEDSEEMVITNIRITDVDLGLRRIPAGFFVVVDYNGLEWTTENKCASVNSNIVEWDRPIPMPSEPSATIGFRIYASFELQPMLGCGEELQKLTVTVKQLLEYNEKALAFNLFSMDGSVKFPSSSLLVGIGNTFSETSAAKVVGRHPHSLTSESQDELTRATNNGHAALTRYRSSREHQDLELSVEQFEHALRLCPLDHPCHAAALSNLATSKFIYYQVHDASFSFGIPMSLYRDALNARPGGHLDRPRTLIQLATVHFARFKKERQEFDAAQAEALLHEAINLSPLESHEKRAAVFMLRSNSKHGAVDGFPSYDNLELSVRQVDPFVLGVSFLRRFERFRDIEDVQQAIFALERSVQSSLPYEDRYFACSENLGIAFITRYNHLGELSDLENAITRFRNVTERSPGYHHKPNLPNNLGNALSSLGNALQTRFNRLGELSDLEDAISKLRDAVKLTPNQNPHKLGRLNSLGAALRIRFYRLGEFSDLQNAILTFRDAVELTPNRNPHKPSCLNNLGSTLQIRFDRLGEVSDLQDAISMITEAVELMPDHHPDKPACLSNLGTALRTRFHRLGKVIDLQDAILRLRGAVELTPDHHPSKPYCLNNLGTSLVTRFHRLGEVSDLEDAISRLKDAVELTHNLHPDFKPGYLNNLGNALVARFDCLGEVNDLQDAIPRLRDAVKLTPDQHPDKPRCLSNLGNALASRFHCLGEVSDLHEALLRLRDAVDLTPNQHPDKSTRLSNLGIALRTRFLRLGEVSDLQDAISRLRDAVELMPDQRPGKPRCLSSLGNALLTRFHFLGEVSDLQDAISRLRDAVELTPNQHPDRPRSLNNLGHALVTRFDRLGEISDLEDAISGLRDTVELTPNRDPDKPARLSNLGNALQSRFRRLGEVRDLEDAVSRLRDAVELTPDQHPDKSRCLNNLGNALRIRFAHQGEVSDLEDAIAKLRDAVELTPKQHPNKPARLSNLGTALRTRFDHLGDVKDLQDAISRLGGAIELMPNHHPDKLGLFFNLGNALRARFHLLRDTIDLEEAISLYSSTALSSIGPATIRLEACHHWLECAHISGHRSLLHAYAVAINILPQLAWAGLSLTDRYRELIKGTDIVREAAAAALDAGLPEIAVEWLEQGRLIIWGDLYQLRNSYDELLGAHPDYAHRLRQLSAELEQASITREKSVYLLSENTQLMEGAAVDSLQKQADRHRDLAINRDKLLQEIRRFPGFERFLLRKELSRLRSSAHTGPVVVLNAAEKRCDALIILAEVEEPIHVPLQNFSPKRSTDIQNSLKRLVVRARVPCDEIERKAKLKGEKSHSWDMILSDLWENVVKPVLDALAFSTPGDLSRIFWCPTGPFTFLPIHAAGLYGTQYSKPGHKVSDFVVSSYIPSLSILKPSPEPANATTHENICFLAIPQPKSDGQIWLPGVNDELQHIRAVIGDCEPGRITLIESSTGTVEEVLSLMKKSDWVHFACHGIQDYQNPTTSGLCLANGHRLMVSDIVSLSRPHGGLAFLSACQTAMGDERLSDEAIHIAAGMLFAGYGGVVGSMWSISDRLAPEVARDVYKRLCQGDTIPDHRNAARALHDAVVRLRDNGESFLEWLPFIHVGL